MTADSYGRFMGRYSEPLAIVFADAAGVRRGHQVLDVGCGPGALTAELVRRVSVRAVTAIDPSPSFVAAIRKRFAAVDVREGVAEQLPFIDNSFDRTCAQLVVHFMTDPAAGLAEMGRVTRPGGVVTACVWDHAGEGSPLAPFWRAAHDVDRHVRDESDLAGAREGHLAELFGASGLAQIESTRLSVTVQLASFADWWEPFTLGVGPAGAYVNGLSESARDVLRSRCAELLPQPPFAVTASAWCVRGVA